LNDWLACIEKIVREENRPYRRRLGRLEDDDYGLLHELRQDGMTDYYAVPMVRASAFKKLADDTVRDLAKSGELAKLYDKWFVQPIPPKNTRVGLPASDATKMAWANPNDKPAEDYAKK